MSTRSLAVGAIATLVALAACGKGDGAPPELGAVAGSRDPLASVAMPAGAATIDGNQFRLAVATLPGCTVDAECAALVELHALGGFKVNLEYPYKFVPAADAAVKPTATFAPTGVHTARLILRFRRPSTEPLALTGTFKLSVCDPERCLIEEAPLAIAVP